MSSIFTKILNGEIPCHKIAEDDHFIAFLDINPLVKGHTLIVPKEEIDYLFDQTDDVLSNILLFSKPIAKAIEKVVPCARIGVTVIGLEVPHTHIHLIPINHVSDMDFSKPKLSFDTSEMEAIAKAIREGM